MVFVSYGIMSYFGLRNKSSVPHINRFPIVSTMEIKKEYFCYITLKMQQKRVSKKPFTVLFLISQCSF